MNILSDSTLEQQRIELRQLLTERFSDEELHTLCFDLGIAYDDLPGQGRAAKVRELLDYLDRHARFSQLAEIGPRVRPDIVWTSILANDGSLTGMPHPPEKAIPHNLPPRSEFVGRGTEKAQVHAALCSRSYLIEINGIGGIGKTSLALEVAYDCLRASRDEKPSDGLATFEGFIWTTARDRDLSLNAMLDTIARTLEYPGIVQQPAEEKRMAIRKLLQAQPCLLVIDNLETITDTLVQDFLLNLPEPSKALITSREQKLREVKAVSIKGLTESEALALIRSEGKRLGLGSLEQAEDTVLLRLYHATGGAPLAIKWSVGQIKQKGQSLDSVLAALHQARGDIFEQVFARSWSLLSADARQVLMVMPLFAAPTLRPALEAASDVHHFALDDALGELVETSLVDASDELDQARRRYSVHPLTRAFAQARQQQKPRIEIAAGEHLAEYVQAFVEEYGSTWYKESCDQLDPELPNIVAVIQWCWEHQLVEIGINILMSVIGFMNTRGYWNDVLSLAQQAIVLATEKGDKLTAARLQMWPVGWICRHRGDLHTAERYTLQALEVFERLDDKGNAAQAKRHLGRIALVRRELDRAEQLFREALVLYQLLGEDDRFTVTIMSNLAEVALRRGELDPVWALCNKAIVLARQLDDPVRVSGLLGLMSVVARQRGDLEQARSLAEEALIVVKRINRLDATPDAYVGLARVEIERKHEQTARQLLESALNIYRELAMHSKVQDVEERLAKLH